jgi:fatty-acyl-CoA synthase
MNLIALDPIAPAEAGKSAAKAWLRALEATAPIAAQPRRILPTVIEELADAHGEAPALLSEHECLTYRELAGRANRYARWALAQEVDKGDTVCLLMPSRPEYLAIWLGVTRVGGIVALLNTNLAGAGLAHCINIVAPRHVIVAAELMEAFEGARPHLTHPARVWTHGIDVPAYTNMEREIERHSDTRLSAAELRPISTADRALLIYTSGTTGLPKAANVSHHRLMTWSFWFAGMMDTRADDRMYDCLPLYHSVGGIVATGAVLVHGGSVVIRPKFSARQFWDDVARFDCTLFQYIGELCRYLLHAPAHPREIRHRLRLACGNGLRADIWQEFRQRFRIPQILEFYAATEANISLFNVEGRPGSIGRTPSFMAQRTAPALVKFDLDRCAPVRNVHGFCIRCAPNEAGEAIGRISANPTDHTTRFDGYSDKVETEKKILRDVFEPGDAWYRTGDLIRRDESGFYFFVDRIGDTFRWKGENVATSEVAAAITSFPGIVDANVYGIAMPGTDGRAGMAELVSTRPIDLAAFRDHLTRNLPRYAHPALLRVQDQINVTPTFKQIKNLAAADLDPDASPDPLYFLDPQQRAYVVLDGALYARILGGRLRL